MLLHSSRLFRLHIFIGIKVGMQLRFIAILIAVVALRNLSWLCNVPWYDIATSMLSSYKAIGNSAVSGTFREPTGLT